MPKLECLCLYGPDYHYPGYQNRTPVQLLANRSPHLREIFIPIPSILSTSEVFRAFGAFKDLGIFEPYFVDEPDSITDDDIDLLARSLPRLRRFAEAMVTDDRFPALDRPVKATGRSLVTLIEHCPALEELGIALDLTDFVESSTPPPSERLEGLQVLCQLRREASDRTLQHLTSKVFSLGTNIQNFVFRLDGP